MQNSICFLYGPYLPELASFFKGNLQINTCYQLIKNYPLPSQIKKTRIDVLTKLLCSASKGHYKKDKATELKKLASVSVGIPSSTFSLKVQLAVDQIEFYTRQIHAVEELIIQSMNELDSVITTIPGINTIFATYILSSIQNINDFDTPCKVLAYAGLDPIIRQSGKFNARNTRMSKRGNRFLRYTLIWSAGNVVLNNKTFKAYHDKKISEGKSHYNALGHCAKKLIKCIFFILKNNVKFNLN